MKPYYHDESSGITIFHGDCLEIMPQLPDVSVRAVVADLPYGMTENKWDSIIPLDNLWSEYRRLLCSNGVVALTAVQPFTSRLVNSNLDWFRHEWIWIKNRGSNFANTVREPFREHESVIVFSPGKWTYNKQMQDRSGAGGDRVKYKINQFSDSDNYREMKQWVNENPSELRVPSSWQKFNTEVGLHPTQKPVPLMDYLIRTYTNSGDLVLDNSMGSGTTLVAAKKDGRRAIGIDTNESYCEIAANRLAQGVLQFGGVA